jgi:hypothetical protein
LTYVDGNGELSNWISAVLHCPCVTSDGQCILKIPDEDYLKTMSSGTLWYDYEFIMTYLFMSAHVQHNTGMQVLSLPYNEKWKSLLQDEEGNMVLGRDGRPVMGNYVISEKACQKLRNGTVMCGTIFYTGSGHFCSALCNVEERIVTVYDGLKYGIETWILHARWLLQRIGVIPSHDKAPHFSAAPGSDDFRLDYNGLSWRLNGPKVFRNQNDGFSCGPIACLHLTKVLGRLKDVTRRDLEYKNAESLREMITSDFRKVLQKIKKDVSVPFREKRKILEADEKEIKTNHTELKLTSRANTQKIENDSEGNNDVPILRTAEMFFTLLLL